MSIISPFFKKINFNLLLINQEWLYYYQSNPKYIKQEIFQTHEQKLIGWKEGIDKSVRMHIA